MTSPSIISLSFGITAREDVQHDLLNAAKVGQSRLDIFINDRIEIANIDFYAPIKKNNLKTFHATKKTSLMKVKDRKLLFVLIEGPSQDCCQYSGHVI